MRQRAGPAPARRSRPDCACGGNPLQKTADDSALTVAFNEPSPPPAAASAAQPTLEVVTGGANQKVVSLGKQKLKIGRSGSNDLVVADQNTSRDHAVVCFDEGHYIIEDLNSTNGVYINDKLIHWSSRFASSIAIPGTEIGMKRIEPSSRGGA